ncbi:MAG TPA: respiratory nitrate reductase subunit gamma [Candidatus Sumerlaeota bacterium]|nr:respiratory nitrate reductase subunit gamma [Candidatus Sumerlaeota bacterium]HPK03114.1 respiratory nitrate reductase subunit gamma [Candidatus Sumerlaeota bacterium]
MLDAFLFLGLPYLALVSLVAGSIWRYRRNRFSYSALSSQFLERKQLRWGSLPWHVGLLVVFIGHLVPFVAPGLWQSLVANRGFLLAVETAGVAAALLALGGLTVLAVRRVFSGPLQRITTTMDLIIVGLLIVQVILGLGVALHHRWGAQWSGRTLGPYLWSVVTLRPEAEWVAAMPPLVKLHVAGAFAIFALLPFSRLVHAFSLPVEYLWRAPQKVVWNNPRRWRMRPAAVRQVEESRRYFLRGAGALAGAGVLLGAGVTDKLVRYFRGPEMSQEQEVALLRKKLERLEMTAEERELELERKRQAIIHVAALAELNRTEGKYFIDYQMRPALAFKDADGLPLLISAKCTHLGCTVASQVDPQGRILCPCHISYFDIATGKPNAGSPAKAPLPHIGWVLMDGAGELIARRAPGGSVEGTPTSQQLEGAQVYIAREYAGGSEA